MNPKKLINILGQLRVEPAHSTLEQWKLHVLEAISKHIPADRANFVSQQNYGPPIQITKNTHLRDNQAYLDHFYALDPLGFVVSGETGLQLAHGPKSRNKVVSLEDVIDQTSFQASEYYNDFLRPLSISNEVIVYLKSNQKILGILSIMRHTSRGFDHREIELLKLLEPYLTTSFESFVNLLNFNQLNQVVPLFEEQTNCGIILLNKKMEIKYSNPMAREMITSFKGDSFNTLPAVIQENCKKLSCHYITSEPTEILLPVKCRLDMGSRSIIVKIRHLTHKCKPFIEGSFAIILEPTQKSGFNKQRTQAHFMLSKREVEIIDCIFKGLKNAQIATALFIGETTVKRHIQNICKKLNVSSRTEIMYEVLKSYDFL